MNKHLLFVISLLAFAIGAPSQQRVESNAQRVQPVDVRETGNSDSSRQAPVLAAPSGTKVDADYVLGPRDQISVTVPDLQDQFTSDQTFRIDMSGDVNLPLAGRIHAAGLTTQGLAEEIDKSLDKILKQPEAVVGIVAFGSQPVSILGEVNNPGIHQIAGRTNLLEALSSAGGFTDNLGSTITITRELKYGSIPLPNAHNDPTGQFSVATLSIKEVVSASNPAENIPVMPDDVISVSRTEVVYAVGSVNKPGGFQLGEQNSLSTLQVLSLAEGLNKTAAPERAMILRATPGVKTRTQIAVNLKQLLQGNGADVSLQPQDILFIPNSKAKSITYRTLEAVIQTATGVAVYGRY